MKVKPLRRVQLFATPWTAAYQTPPSMGFSRQEYWTGLPLPSPIVYIHYVVCQCLNKAGKKWMFMMVSFVRYDKWLLFFYIILQILYNQHGLFSSGKNTSSLNFYVLWFIRKREITTTDFMNCQHLGNLYTHLNTHEYIHIYVYIYNPQWLKK